MTFTKINDYTVQCVIPANEIDQMGYVLQELYTNKEAASRFMRSVMEKGEEAGFQLNRNLQEIQVVLHPNGELILSFTEVNPDSQVNHMLESALEAYDAIEAIGRERVEEIMNMAGKEKIEAFQEIIAKYKKIAEGFLQIEEAEEEAPKNNAKEAAGDKFMLRFSDFSHLEKLCKSVAIKVPSHLYKENKQYYLLADFTGINQDKRDSFMLQALDFEARIEGNKLLMAHIEEHGKYMIENEAIEVLKKI
ncbi:adaptor protein MecA [Konateibacter massiliensis]|uniref:adaptor protein MecA n=1 Tax=Konateibacter massiliensis TaxID=2002841 RepID=UPI0015D48363|nr:adaptor protein MecA [Konateibacter massiliensis]